MSGKKMFCNQFCPPPQKQYQLYEGDTAKMFNRFSLIRLCLKAKHTTYPLKSCFLRALLKGHSIICKKNHFFFLSQPFSDFLPVVLLFLYSRFILPLSSPIKPISCRSSFQIPESYQCYIPIRLMMNVRNSNFLTISFQVPASCNTNSAF